MPLKSRLVIAGYVAAFVLASAALLIVAAPAGAWAVAGVAALLCACAALALDAFHPRVNLFMPALVSLPQRTGRRTIALTFDDGPVPQYTPQVLDVLDRYHVKATFFCIGDNARRYPELVRQIVARGHTLGNHTQTHRSLLLAGSQRVARELDAAEAALHAACGERPLLFRCPKGYKNPIVARVLRRRGMRLVGYGYPIWDVQNPPPQQLVDRVLQRAAAGDIIVMHDGFPAARPGRRDSLVAALPAIISGLLAKGLTPVALDQAFSGQR